MDYKPTIGLEIHAELNTRTKMFCGCLNDFDEHHPNSNVCPICLGHPGMLPTANKKAIESVLKVGLALNSTIPKKSKFDRKNYFYPDLPKGYQISQFDMPLCDGGYLEIPGGKKIRLRRVHLEEDTARLLHSTDGKSSLVDFNRGGMPLMELVTEPDIESGKEAANFAKELRLIFRYLGISDADMEKGQMRVEANISVSTSDKLGTKVEIKNLNSFRIVEDAVAYEIKRQEEVLESGGKIVQETRGWDDVKKVTVSQRLKEESHDYRYFPEPDLPPLDLTDKNFINLENLRAELPELPAQKRTRFATEYGLTSEQAEVLVNDRKLAEFFEEAVSESEEEAVGDSPSRNAMAEQSKKSKLISLTFNYLTSDLKGIITERGIVINDIKITPENFADLIALVAENKISSRTAKDVLVKMLDSGADPKEIVAKEGLEQVFDEGAIRKAVEETIAENPNAIEDYKKGKQNVLQFLMGKTMVKLKGKGNPDMISKLLKEILG